MGDDAWQDFMVREDPPGQFSTLIGNVIIRSSTEADIEFYKYYQRSKSVHAETVAVALAINAVSAILISQSTSIVVILICLAGFLISTTGSYALFNDFIVQKLPHHLLRAFEKIRNRNPVLRIFRIRGYLYREWLRSTFNVREFIDLDSSYLTLLVGFDLTFLGLAAWVTVTILNFLS